jgi:hypothetical protein
MMMILDVTPHARSNSTWPSLELQRPALNEEQHMPKRGRWQSQYMFELLCRGLHYVKSLLSLGTRYYDNLTSSLLNHLVATVW